MHRLAYLVALPLLFDSGFALMLAETDETQPAQPRARAGTPAYSVSVDCDDATSMTVGRRVVHMAAHHGALCAGAPGAPPVQPTQTDPAAPGLQRARLVTSELVRDGVSADRLEVEFSPGRITLLHR